ncbi:unnamed protein product [Candidula unifasciata]|uniref:Ileal sodium/bile acid cotransporter n=1 Tax=Candidula unifasciata TaxID=100452 RepID=A0A8S3ZG46_9EUPU|nr:unnamed protein product [Candidula unifasciata]
MGSRIQMMAIFSAASVLVVTGNSSESSDLNNTQPASFTAVPGIPVSVQVISNIGMPGALLYNRKSDSVISLTYSLNCTSYDTVYRILATTSAENVAKITDNSSFNISCMSLKLSNSSYQYKEDHTVTMADMQEDMHINRGVLFLGVVNGHVNMTVEAGMIGRSFMLLFAHKLSGAEPRRFHFGSEIHKENASFLPDDFMTNTPYTTEISVSAVTDARKAGAGIPGLPPNVVGRAMIIVMQLPRTIDEVFRVVLYVVIVLATAGMGVKVDFFIIKHTLRKPVAPIIGLGCQYICMPLIAYLVAKVVPQESPAISLGIFACGIVPGGGQSNMFAYLLGGDLSLSATMTTLSNIASLGLLPMWIFTLGETFKDDTVKLHVPFEKILEALAIAILPLFVGMFIRYKFPKVANIIGKVLKPVLIVIVAFIISFGIYINIYIFEMIRPMTIVAGCLLPYIGYILGGFIAFLCCRTWTEIKTIAIETGIQNSTIAFMILYLSLPPPDNQLATVGPAASAIMTPLPPLRGSVFVHTLPALL